MPAEYYNKLIYPIQDKVIPAFQNTPFYLTGGTALSRGYFNHRYSDDLDYFVNDHSDFQRIAERQIEKIRKIFDEINIAAKDKNSYRIFVSKEKLKIEMINDVPCHIGKLVNHPAIGVLDSKENILANKLTAVIDRSLPKDIVDIYFLLKDGLSIKQALTDASSKAAGITPLLIAKILAEFDYEIIRDEIKWVAPVSQQIIRQYLTKISLAIAEGTI